MKKTIKKLSIPISNDRGMELISYIALIVITVTIGALVWASTDVGLGSHVNTIADKLNILFG